MRKLLAVLLLSSAPALAATEDSILTTNELNVVPSRAPAPTPATQNTTEEYNRRITSLVIERMPAPDQHIFGENEALARIEVEISPEGKPVTALVKEASSKEMSNAVLHALGTIDRFPPPPPCTDAKSSCGRYEVRIAFQNQAPPSIKDVQSTMPSTVFNALRNTKQHH